MRLPEFRLDESHSVAVSGVELGHDGFNKFASFGLDSDIAHFDLGHCEEWV
jgi:hypothetical protein